MGYLIFFGAVVAALVWAIRQLDKDVRERECQVSRALADGRAWHDARRADMVARSADLAVLAEQSVQAAELKAQLEAAQLAEVLARAEQADAAAERERLALQTAQAEAKAAREAAGLPAVPAPFKPARRAVLSPKEQAAADLRAGFAQRRAQGVPPAAEFDPPEAPPEIPEVLDPPAE